MRIFLKHCSLTLLEVKRSTGVPKMDTLAFIVYIDRLTDISFQKSLPACLPACLVSNLWLTAHIPFLPLWPFDLPQLP